MGKADKLFDGSDAHLLNEGAAGPQGLALDEIKQWMIETEGKGGIARRDHVERLIGEVERLHKERGALERGIKNIAGAIYDLAKEHGGADEETIEQFLTRLSAERDSYKEDAERWRAIVGCARVRVLGTAGIIERKADGYAHLGVELWTRHTASSEPLALEWLTAFADIARSLNTNEKA